MKVDATKHLSSKLALLIFKIMGLAPFAIRESANVKKSSKDNWQAYANRNASPEFVNSRTGSLYNCALILVQLCLCSLSVPMEFGFHYPGKTKVTATIEICLAVCGNSVIVVVWLMYCAKQNDVVNLLNRLTKVDATFDRLNGATIAYDSRNLIILFATNIFAWIQLLSSEKLAFHAPVITWFAFITPSIIVNWFIVQYVVALKLIENRLRHLNKVLHGCSMNSVVFPLRSFLIESVPIDDLQVPTIVTLRRAHTCLYEISRDLAEFYSLPILMAVGFVSFLSFYNAYYSIAPFILDTEKPTCWAIVNSIFWLVVLIPIVLLAAGVNRVTAELKRPADVIPDLFARRTTSCRDKTELETFSYELLHKNVEFTAYKFFPLDGTLVRSVLGAICTYLTIIFQLQVESSSGKSHLDRNVANTTGRTFEARSEH